MAVARIARDRLDGMADRVTQVEHLARTGITLVDGDDPKFRPGAGQHDLRRGGIGPGADRLPELAPGDQGVPGTRVLLDPQNLLDRRRDLDVSGARLGLLGRGDVKAELTASADAKLVRIAQVGGTLEITALSDDVQIKCKSRGAAKGDTSASCTGKAVLATVTGSHFSIHASGKHYALGIPAGG